MLKIFYLQKTDTAPLVVSKCIVVYLVYSETMTFMYDILFSIKFIAVLFEVGMFREVKLSQISI